MEETAQTYNAIYGDRTWEQITLGEMINKGGAAGRIFRVKGHPQLVAKIFHNLNKAAPTGKSCRPCCSTGRVFRRQ